MTAIYFKSILLITFFLNISHLNAQRVPTESPAAFIQTRLENYSTNFESTRLHLHLDKTIYTDNETIWFSAFIWNSINENYSHKSLFVKLVRKDNDSIIRSLIFPVYNHHSNGNIEIPNAVKTGEYKIIAHTDKLINGNPSVVFVQPLSIKTAVIPNYTVSVQLVDTLLSSKDSFMLRIIGNKRNGDALKNANCQYEIFGGGKRISHGKCTLNISGEATLFFKYTKQLPLRFVGNFNNNSDKRTVELPVRKFANFLHASFFPEGGSIIANTQARVAMELSSSNGEPVETQVQLYSNDNLVQTVVTDKNGFGVFEFSANHGQTFTASLNTKDSLYKFELPLIKEKGYSIQVHQAVIKDSIKISIQKNEPGIQVNLWLHNFKDLFWGGEIAASRKQSTAITIPVNEIPEGIYAITLTNNEFQPLAERLVYIKEDKAAILLNTDKKTYSTRSKILLDVSFNNLADSLNNIQLSVSSTHFSRIDPSIHTNILTTCLITDELERPLKYPFYLLIDTGNNNYTLNRLLLTKGWRNYTWEEMLHSAKITSPRLETLHPVKGKVISKKQAGPFEVAILKKGLLIPYVTETDGSFIIPAKDLITEPNDQILLVKFEGDKKNDAKFLLDTMVSHIQKKIIGLIPNQYQQIISPIEVSNKDVLETEDGYKLLETAVIRAKNNTTGYFKSNNCNDYVCQYNILNCTNHIFGHPPKDGEVYFFKDKFSTELKKIIYQGCKAVKEIVPAGFLALNQLNIGKEFYKSNYEKEPFTEPEYLTTLYWNPLVSLANNATFKDSFFSSDSKGKYIVIVEGIINGKPAHTQTIFFVE